MRRRLSASLLLFVQLGWLAPAGVCPHTARSAESEPSCHDAAHAGTDWSAIESGGECTDCQVPACRSMSSCAPGSMVTAETRAMSVLHRRAEPAVAEMPEWSAGELPPPLPPPPRA